MAEQIYFDINKGKIATKYLEVLQYTIAMFGVLKNLMLWENLFLKFISLPQHYFVLSPYDQSTNTPLMSVQANIMFNFNISRKYLFLLKARSYF